MDSSSHQLLNIEEKPTWNYFINAGIYIFTPDVLHYFSNKMQCCDMPFLLQELVRANQFVSTFPIREYWLDVGSHDNLTQAIVDYEKIFI